MIQNSNNRITVAFLAMIYLNFPYIPSIKRPFEDQTKLDVSKYRLGVTTGPTEGRKTIYETTDFVKLSEYR